MAVNEMASSENARERMLRAAGPIFAQHGFEAATVREIATAADVNVASIAYYFGDKMRLYLEVIRETKRRQAEAHPIPELSQYASPETQLEEFIAGLLARVLECESGGWEFQLMMREMYQPTDALSEIVDEFFRPLFEQLEQLLDALAGQPLAEGDRIRLALSVVGQCLYYRVGHVVLQRLLSDQRRESHLKRAQLARHIATVTIAATRELAGGRSRGPAGTGMEAGPAGRLFDSGVRE